MPSAIRSIGVHLFVALFVAIASCGGGGSGSQDVFVSGAVLSPNGHVIALESPGPGDPARAPTGPMHENGRALGVSGLLPVPDGTPVELVRLDAAGDPILVLADTTTAAGGFLFNLTDHGVALASDLAVTAGTGASRMRALVVEEELDVDPVSEATVLAMLEPSLGLADFTLQEALDAAAAVRLLAAAESIAAGPDVATTVAALERAIAAAPSVVTFIGLAADAGQTSAGPGDVGDYFPLHVGDASKLAGTITFDNDFTEPRTIARRVVGVDARDVFTIEEFVSGDVGTQVGDLREKTSAGIIDHGLNVPGNELSRAVTPFLEVRFPLRVGEARQQFAAQGIPLDLDLDSDGIGETLDATSTQTTAAFEDVTTPAGSFERCVRLDTRVVLLVRYSSGARATVRTLVREWFAPGIGLVRRHSEERTLFDDVVDVVVELEETYELESYQVGDDGHGVLPPLAAAIDLTQANSNSENPGRPGLASDGERFLLVTCRDLQPRAELIGVMFQESGLVQGELHLTAEDVVCGSVQPAVAFDGTNYLIVFHKLGQIVGMRVTPEGDVLDTTPFPISTSGSSNFSPALAFDGAQWLVVWRKFLDQPGLGRIYASFVTPGGAALGEFAVSEAPITQGIPDVVFANGNYVVVWEEGSLDMEIRGARVTPAGVVLDPTGFDVADDTQPQAQARIASDGDGYLVVWSTPPVLSLFGYHIYGARLAADCTQLGAPFPIATGADFWAQPTVAFDGTNYLVAFGSATFRAPFGVHVKRVSTGGELLDGDADSHGITVDEPPLFARLFYPVIALSTTRALIAWLVNIELSGERKSIEAAVIHPF